LKDVTAILKQQVIHPPLRELYKTYNRNPEAAGPSSPSLRAVHERYNSNPEVAGHSFPLSQSNAIKIQQQS